MFALRSTLGSSSLPIAAFALTMGVHASMPTPAHACGGTFCDNVTGMAVDQTGENILFAVDGERVEAHIQIQYDPNSGAETFAWVVPVSEIPEFSVGSDRLFQNLLDGSVPFYGTRIASSCDDDSDGDSSSGESEGGDSGGEDDGADTDGDTDPDVVKEESVGAYDLAVLQGGTVDSVMAWLEDNGFAQDEAARPILDAYLQEGFLFVAMKLRNNADVAEIQPIVLGFQEQEPCVPIRLTRIAAVEDMDIRTFFLSDSRTIPSNYRHVEVNPLAINWLTNGANYRDVVTMAVDADHAEGNAFVTEYAGNSNTVTDEGLFDFAWNADAIADLQARPTEVVEELGEQRLMRCQGGGNTGQTAVCGYFHNLLRPLLLRYLPVPEGLDENEFYSCLECYEHMIDADAWMAEDFANDLNERIFEPGLHAVRMLERHEYLTRMYTTISPYEMNLDPMFQPGVDLPEVPNRRVATRTFDCDGASTVSLPSGEVVHIPVGGTWPDFPDDMPWERQVSVADDAGELQLLADRSEDIERILCEWNASQTGENCDSDSTGTTTADSGADETATTGADTTAEDTTGDPNTGTGGEAGTGTGVDPGTGGDMGGIDPAESSSGESGDLAIEDASGCGCRGSSGSGPMGVFMLAGLGWLATRRRRRVN